MGAKRRKPEPATQNQAVPSIAMNLHDAADAAESMTCVQCDRCGKWRELVGAVPDALLDTEWFCELNADQKYSSCEVAEQEWSDDGDGELTTAMDGKRRTVAGIGTSAMEVAANRAKITKLEAKLRKLKKQMDVSKPRRKQSTRGKVHFDLRCMESDIKKNIQGRTVFKAAQEEYSARRLKFCCPVAPNAFRRQSKMERSFTTHTTRHGACSVIRGLLEEVPELEDDRVFMAALERLRASVRWKWIRMGAGVATTNKVLQRLSFREGGFIAINHEAPKQWSDYNDPEKIRGLQIDYIYQRDDIFLQVKTILDKGQDLDGNLLLNLMLDPDCGMFGLATKNDNRGRAAPDVADKIDKVRCIAFSLPESRLCHAAMDLHDSFR
jgi:hypothetical protein